MSDIAIKVEGLGKNYLLRHQQQGRRYKALRDVLADKAKSRVRPGAGVRLASKWDWSVEFPESKAR